MKEILRNPLKAFKSMEEKLFRVEPYEEGRDLRLECEVMNLINFLSSDKGVINASQVNKFFNLLRQGLLIELRHLNLEVTVLADDAYQHSPPRQQAFPPAACRYALISSYELLTDAITSGLLLENGLLPMDEIQSEHLIQESVPELKDTIDFLITAFKSEYLVDQVRGNVFLKLHKERLAGQLQALSLGERPYPYSQSLIVIENAVKFFEALGRCTKDNIPPKYHADRYTYHNQALRACSDFFVLPSEYPLTFRDLIKLRSVPIGIIGVVTRTSFADAYFNSPWDFYVHDANHTRRFRSYNSLFFKKHNIVSRADKIRAYEEFDAFIRTNILPHIVYTDASLTEYERNKRKMIRIIHFECLHEYAHVPHEDSYLYLFNHCPGDPQPFEVMETTAGEHEIPLEARRLPSFNLRSGVSYVPVMASRIYVKYILDEGPHVLTSVLNKLTTGFYDNQFTGAYKELPDKKYRTADMVICAASAIIDTLGIRDEIAFTHEKFLAIASNSLYSGVNKKRLEVYPDKDTKRPEITMQDALHVLEMRKQAQADTRYVESNDSQSVTDYVPGNRDRRRSK